MQLWSDHYVTQKSNRRASDRISVDFDASDPVEKHCLINGSLVSLVVTAFFTLAL